MSRTFQDADLLTWEAYASGGRHGFTDHAKIVFHCTSDRERRARFVERDGDQAAAEREVEEMTVEELRELLERAGELD